VDYDIHVQTENQYIQSTRVVKTIDEVGQKERVLSASLSNST